MDLRTLKKLEATQKQINEYRRQFRPTQAAYKRLAAANEALASARWTREDAPEYAAKVAKAEEIMSIVEAKGPQGVAF